MQGNVGGDWCTSVVQYLAVNHRPRHSARDGVLSSQCSRRALVSRHNSVAHCCSAKVARPCSLGWLLLLEVVRVPRENIHQLVKPWCTSFLTLLGTAPAFDASTGDLDPFTYTSCSLSQLTGGGSCTSSSKARG